MSTRSRRSRASGNVTSQTTTSTSSRVSSSSTSAAETPGPSTPPQQQQASTSFSTPRVGTPGRARPPSPTVLSRAHEKDELVNLNDRLANYIDKVRSLETENSRLTKIVRSHEEVQTREVTNIKSLYEGELQDARRLLDETSRDKAQLSLENEKLSSDNKELRARNVILEREVNDLKKSKLAAEAQVNDLQARLNDAVNQRKHFEAEYQKAKREADDLRKQLATLQKQVEEETIQRVDLSNRIQSLKEELNFKQAIHDKQVEEQRVRMRTEIEEVDGRVHEEYESRLREAIQQMREENDAAIEQAREDTEAMYAAKLAYLKDTAGKNDQAADAMRQELKGMRKRVEELSKKVTTLTGQNSGYVTRINDLEGRLGSQEEDFADQKRALNAEIQRLRVALSDQRKRAEDLSGEVSSLTSQITGYVSQISDLEARLSRQEDEFAESRRRFELEIERLRAALEDQLTEYRDLLDVKIQLDNEIQSYRRMLESEETRLNISADESTPSRSARRTPVRTGRKRKRTDDLGGSYFQQHSSAARVAYQQSSSAKGHIQISETDTDGKFIKLFNNSDKDEALGGWTLKHVVGEEETVYKFHRSIHLKGQQSITVWSADSGETHDPSSGNIVMKQRWFTGDVMKTELFDSQGEEQASRDLEKTELHRTYDVTGLAAPSATLEEDPREKCAIM